MNANPVRGMDRVVAPGAKVEKLAGGFEFTEGPTCDAAGNVFFTDQPNDRILKWSVEGRLSTFLQPAGRANGMYFDARGQPDRLRRREERAVVDRAGRQDHGDPERIRGQAAERSERRLGAAERRALLHRPVLQADLVDPPHDAAGRPARLLPVRRPPAARARGRRPRRSPTASSARPTGRRCTWPTSALGRPIGTTSSRTAALVGKTLVVEHGSDGMTLDTEGNLYLTGDGVHGVRPGRAGRSSTSRFPTSAGRRTSASAARTDRRSSSRPARPVRGQDARAGGQRGEVGGGVRLSVLSSEF